MDKTNVPVARTKEGLRYLASRRGLLRGAAIVAGGLAIGGLEKPITALASHDRDEERGVVLAFETMVGVTRPFVGSANPQRGLNGGGLPWTIAQAKGRLNAGGELKVRVQGLVLANTNAAPAALRGTNPVPAFRAVVSCLTIDAR